MAANKKLNGAEVFWPLCFLLRSMARILQTWDWAGHEDCLNAALASYDWGHRRLGWELTLDWRPRWGRQGVAASTGAVSPEEKQCSVLPASNSDLPSAAIWYVTFLAPKQSQAIKAGTLQADRGWMVIAFLYLLPAYLAQQELQENFLIIRALSWAAHGHCQWHCESVVIALGLGKSPGAVGLLRKQSWRKGERETGPYSKGCCLKHCWI